MQKISLKYKKPSRLGARDLGKYVGKLVPTTISRSRGMAGGDRPPIVVVPTLPTPQVTAALTVGTTLQIGWSPVTDAITYSLFRNTVNSVVEATLLTITPNAILYTDSGLETETTYYYFVIAHNEGYRDSAP